MKHGTLSGYTKDKCRCVLCQTYWNAYQLWYKYFRLPRRHMRCPTCSCEKPKHPDDIPDLLDNLKN